MVRGAVVTGSQFVPGLRIFLTMLGCSKIGSICQMNLFARYESAEKTAENAEITEIYQGKSR